MYPASAPQWHHAKSVPVLHDTAQQQESPICTEHIEELLHQCNCKWESATSCKTECKHQFSVVRWCCVMKRGCEAVIDEAETDSTITRHLHKINESSHISSLCLSLCVWLMRWVFTGVGNNTDTAPVFITSCCCCQVPAAHPHTSESDAITVGYHLISTPINTGKHTARWLFVEIFQLSNAISLEMWSADQMEGTEGKKGEEKHSQSLSVGKAVKEHGWKRLYLALIMQLWKTSGGWGNSFWFEVIVAWQPAGG